MNSKATQRQYDLDFMRVIAILAVITIHCIAPVINTQPTDSFSWNIANIIEGFTRWSVPVFVMISGALVIKPTAHTDTAIFYKKRLKKLFFPMALWPIIYFVWNAVYIGKNITVKELLHGYLAGDPPIGYHLYFLFLIAGLYLLSPFISAYVSVVTRRQLWMTCIALLVATSVWFHLEKILPGHRTSLNIITQCLPYVGYFLAGYLVVHSAIRLQPVLIMGVSLAACLLIAAASYVTFSDDKSLPFYGNASVLVILSSLSVFLSLQAIYRLYIADKAYLNALLGILSPNVFGIYLIHVMVIGSSISALDINATSIKNVPFLFFSTLILSFGSVWVLGKIPGARRLLG